MAATVRCRKVYKFRMEPTGLEALELERAASVARFVYNWTLGQSKQYYHQHGKSKPWGELSADLTQLKRTELWLYDFDSQMLQQVLADLRRAYINFFEGRAKFPRFETNKTKKRSRLGFRLGRRRGARTPILSGPGKETATGAEALVADKTGQPQSHQSPAAGR